jgi:2-keto-4-pentenoate hydratase/2-oxohepta-3-ene-1,7-dioic acid hydratase in catechol pathway
MGEWLIGMTSERGHTTNMVFTVARLVAYVSRFMALRPGNVIATGDAVGRRPRREAAAHLQPGDVGWRWVSRARARIRTGS